MSEFTCTYVCVCSHLYNSGPQQLFFTGRTFPSIFRTELLCFVYFFIEFLKSHLKSVFHMNEQHVVESDQSHSASTSLTTDARACTVLLCAWGPILYNLLTNKRARTFEMLVAIYNAHKSYFALLISTGLGVEWGLALSKYHHLLIYLSAWCP